MYNIKLSKEAINTLSDCLHEVLYAETSRNSLVSSKQKRLEDVSKELSQALAMAEIIGC